MALWRGLKPTCKRSLQFSPKNHQHQQPLIVLQRIIIIVTVIAALCCAQIAILRSAWYRDPIPTVISAEVPLPKHLHTADWVDASGHTHTATVDIAALPSHDGQAQHHTDQQGSRRGAAWSEDNHMGPSCLLERLEQAYAAYAANTRY